MSKEFREEDLIKELPAQPVCVICTCPFCNDGEMEVSEYISRHAIEHMCTKCSQKLQLTKQYPYIKWNKV